jgi:hypothetical protein
VYPKNGEDPEVAWRLLLAAAFPLNGENVFDPLCCELNLYVATYKFRANVWYNQIADEYLLKNAAEVVLSRIFEHL